MPTTKMISLSSITPNPNLRKPTIESIDAMAASMADIGQLSPIGALETESGYLIIFGNTRYFAGKKLGWEELTLSIFPPNTSAADCLRISISENSVREQMTFVESFDAIHEYAKLRGLKINQAGLTQAGKELNYRQSHISKCLKTNERLSARNKKKLVAAGIGGSLAYLISQETKLQDQLVDSVIEEEWSRKQLEQYFRQKRRGVTKFEYRHDGAKLVLDVPRSASPDKVLALLKAFAQVLKKNSGFDLATAARRIKEQANVVS